MAETKAIQKSPAQTVADLVESMRPKWAPLVPKHVSPDRLLRVLVGTLAKSDSLQKCTAASLVDAFRVCAELGLEPGGALGHMYLVPFGSACTPIIGYRGLIELMRRSGRLASIRACVVHEKDKFKYREGLEQVIEHEPYLDGDPGPMRFVYVVARLADGGVQAEVMSRSGVDAIRARSRAGQSGPWVSDYEEMAKKTVVRRAAKYLPMAAEVAEVLEREDDVDGEARVVSVETLLTATERAAAAVEAKLSAGAETGAT